MLLPLVAAGAQSACLLPSPPDYEEGERIPPVIEVIQPTPYFLHEYSRGDSIEFVFTVRSNDTTPNGETSSVFYWIYRNFENFTGDGAETAIATGRLDPSSFEDEGQRVSRSYTFQSEEDGCHQYTLFATHLDNGNPPDEVERPEDVALVVWWINIETDDVPNDIRSCLTEGRQ